MLLTGANAFFVAAEFSLVTVDRAAIDQQARGGRRDRPDGADRALRELSFQLSGAQLGITLSRAAHRVPGRAGAVPAALARSSASSPGADRHANALALVIATLFSMLFGELVPKNAALARPMPTRPGDGPAAADLLRGSSAG